MAELAQGPQSAPLPVRRARADDATVMFGLFAALFALSLILHQLWWDGFEVRSPHFLVISAALWVVLRPTSVRRFLTMIAVEVFALAADMPEVGSHTLLVLVSGSCLLAYVGWTTGRSRQLPDAGALYERIAPFFRLELLVVYAAAAMAKINSGFFDTDVSCAASMSSHLAWFHPPLLGGSWQVAGSIWTTVAIEGALPVLLAVRRTRVIGLVVGGAFHAVLALAGNVPFSALALALYVAFLPPEAARLCVLTIGSSRAGRWASTLLRWTRSPAALPLGVGCWLAGAATFTYVPADRPALISHGTRLIVVVVSVAEVLATLNLARRGAQGYQPRSLRLGHPVFALGILLLVVNSLSPYVGLKTESSLTMFSNLRTEDGRWNHLLIPEAVRIFPYQDQLVRITASNDPALEATTRDGTRLVRFELERYLRSHPGTRASYATTAATGETIRTAGSDAQHTALPTTRVLDKIVKFQAVPPPERGGC